MKFHRVHASPLKYGQTVVAFVNTIVHLEYMKDKKHILSLYLICIAVFTHQHIMGRVSNGEFRPKNGVSHITFEGVPAQYQPKYFITECILSQYKSYLSK